MDALEKEIICGGVVAFVLWLAYWVYVYSTSITTKEAKDIISD